MSERLADIEARIGGVRQLGAVVNAMRGIAAARAQQARRQIMAVDTYAHTIATAIRRALALLPGDAPDEATPGGARTALLVFGAEQGFAGAFGEHVLDAVAAGPAPAELLLVGTRSVALAAARKMAVTDLGSMPAHPAGVPRLADRICEILYSRIAAGGIDRLEVVFSEWRAGQGVAVTASRLFPMDLPARAAGEDPPLVNLAPGMLLASLTADYLHARLCHAALHAFAAENEVRMQAMAAARSHAERQLAELEGTRRRLRQDQITAEIIELAAGEAAAAFSSHF